MALVESVVRDVPARRLRYLAPSYVEILAELARWDELARFAGVLGPLLDHTPYVRPYVERAEARAKLAAGDRAGAVERFEAALAGFSQLSYPFEVARTAELLAEVADEDRRRELLGQARQAYESLGARPALDRVAALLAQH